MASFFSTLSRSFFIALKKWKLILEISVKLSESLPYLWCSLLHLCIEFFLKAYFEIIQIFTFAERRKLTFSTFRLSRAPFKLDSISDMNLISNCFLDFKDFSNCWFNKVLIGGIFGSNQRDFVIGWSVSLKNNLSIMSK